MFDSRHNYKDFLAGAILGGTLGAMTAMMLGTRKGKKMQKELMGKYKHFSSKAELLKDEFLKEAMKTKHGKLVRRAFKNATKKRRPAKKARRRSS